MKKSAVSVSELFEPELAELFFDQSIIMPFKAGDVILDFGQPIRAIPFILSGIIKVSRTDEEGRELLLYYINTSESCAMTFTSHLEQHTSEIRATAEEDGELAAVPVELMDHWMQQYPTWKRFVMRTIKTRFNELLVTIDHVAFRRLDERLVKYLKDKSAATGSSLVNLSHEKIAADLASSRVVISRLLKVLEDNQQLILYRHQIKLLPVFLNG